MKILIIPDSFKGSLSSKEVCIAIKNSLEKTNSKYDISTLPFADGGEGFADCIADICNGDILYTNCHDIYHRPIQGNITVLGETAVIECACASGIQQKKNVMNATSYGTGELIKFAVSKGYHNIILGLGGTGCCDGGAGALSALGADFYDINYRKIEIPKGKDLNDIYGFGSRNIVKDINFTFACDVTNEYYGPNGAAFVFAPQKGASKTDVSELDEGLKRLNAFFPTDISKVKGAGAAGGICGGLYAVYRGNIRSGFDILSEYAHLEEKIKDCDIMITGEGKTDRQTLMGKLPYKIADLAKRYKKKCFVISGSIEDGVSFGDKMISLTDETISVQKAMKNAAEILTEKAKYLLK